MEIVEEPGGAGAERGVPFVEIAADGERGGEGSVIGLIAEVDASGVDGAVFGVGDAWVFREADFPLGCAADRVESRILPGIRERRSSGCPLGGAAGGVHAVVAEFA